MSSMVAEISENGVFCQVLSEFNAQPPGKLHDTSTIDEYDLTLESEDRVDPQTFSVWSLYTFHRGTRVACRVIVATEPGCLTVALDPDYDRNESSEMVHEMFRQIVLLTVELVHASGVRLVPAHASESVVSFGFARGGSLPS